MPERSRPIEVKTMCVLRLIHLCESNEWRRNHASVDQSLGNRRPIHLILFRVVFFICICWELQFLGCNFYFIKTHKDTRSERMSRKSIQLPHASENMSVYYIETMRWWRKMGIVNSLNAGIATKFVVFRWFNFIFCALAASDRNCVNITYIQVSKKNSAFCCNRYCCWYKLFFFLGALAIGC